MKKAGSDPGLFFMRWMGSLRPKAELGRQGKQPFNAALEGAQRVEGTNTGQENGEAMTVVCMRLTNHLGGYAIVIRVNCFYVFEVV